MDQTTEQFQPAEGMTVFASDGDKVGKVVAAQGNYIVVEKGFFFPKDYYVPRSAIVSQDGENIYLSMSKDEALNSGWDREPSDYGTDMGDAAMGSTMGMAGGAGLMGGAGGTSIPDQGGSGWLGQEQAGVMTGDTAGGTSIPQQGGQEWLGTGMASEEDSSLSTGTSGSGYDANRTGGSTSGVIGGSFDAATSDTSTTNSATGDDRIVVPVHEETLTASTRPVEAGQVEVGKRVVSEQQSIDVPVTEERLRVTRRAVDREGADANAFEDQTIDVPLRSEQVDVQKRVRVAEEVEIGKEKVQSTQRVSDTVRREVVDVNDQTQPIRSGSAADAGSVTNASASASDYAMTNTEGQPADIDLTDDTATRRGSLQTQERNFNTSDDPGMSAMDMTEGAGDTTR